MKQTITALIISAFCILNFAYTGCKVSYGFSEKNAKLPDSIRTVNVHIFENRAPYQNPQLVPALTDRVKQKITRQTKLTQTNRDDADLDVTGVITDYSVTTTGVTSTNGQSQTSINRLTVSVQVTINMKGDVRDVTVSRSFDFSARQSLNQAEGQLLDEMVRNLSDEIFNRIFSDW